MLESQDNISFSEKPTSTMGPLNRVQKKVQKKAGSFIISLVLFCLLLVIFIVLITSIIKRVSDQNILDTTYSLVLSVLPTDKNYSEQFPSKVSYLGVVDPINGRLYSKEENDAFSIHRPIITMIDNDLAARPQSGLSKADIVYEAPVEDGSSSYMAIFYAANPTQIGPVTSTRTYFLDLASEYDGIMYYIGDSSTDTDETDPNNRFQQLDTALYVKRNNLRTTSCSHYPDNQRISIGIPPEHAQYMSISQVRKCMGTKLDGKAVIESWKFKSDSSLSTRAVSSELNMTFGGYNEQNKVRWVYDRETNTYKRSQGSVVDIDRNDSTSISAKNVIVQFAEKTDIGDHKQRFDLTLYGEGTVYVLQDGQVIKGKWKKTSRLSRTRYFDDSGSEIFLNRGLSWVTIMPANRGEPIGDFSVI